ncbi:Homeobox transcription factor phx1 [Beauveria bassiana]|nr:Homeobox transcription factor phx1 [Beauveria bassiana]
MTEPPSYRGMPSSDQLWKSRLDTRGDVGSMGHYGTGSVSGPSAPASLGMGHGEAEEYSDDGDVGEGESEGMQQTAAERLASRRKMKRFRLTHQQTRFLMSEFAKQPHPDAAHRERLAKEIPGLTARQVQVWFQNRRAKIKRLNADDRERVVQMRAVPENFDNVQALHSPYGAVQAYDGSLSHTSSHQPPHMYQHPRPLMVDVRRTESEAHPMQSTGLTPVFGGINFGQNHVPGMLETNSMLSSPSQFSPSDRYGYGPRQPGVGVSDGKGSSTSSPVHETDHRSGARPLRPAALADPLSRGRSSSLQSTMGSSVYWRGSGLGDVAEVQDPASEHGSEGQAPSLHTSTSGMGLNTLFYGGDASAQQSGATGDMAARQDPFPRNRAASASFPLENRGQYSELGAHPMLSPIRTDVPRSTPSAQAGTAYTPSYASPLPLPAGASAPNTRLLEPRDHMPQFGYTTGDTSTTAVHGFSSQAANDGVDQRPFYPPGTQQSSQFERPGNVVSYGETAQASNAVKRE